MSNQDNNSKQETQEQLQETNDNHLNESIQQASESGRRARPARANLRRQLMGVAPSGDGPPLVASVELAGVVARGPPKRPAHLPARYDTYSPARHAPLGAAPADVAAAGASVKPNRYAWAQMQQWQQASANQQHQHQHNFSSHLPFSSAASRVLVVNPMQIVNLSEHTKSRLIKFIEAVKRFSEQWFSHVLLLLFLAVYACFGAYIFISFEASNEHREKQLINDTKTRILNETWSEAKAREREAFIEALRPKLDEFELILNRACASGMTSSSLENQWTFWGALFYSMTVFTTIGYGHLTPVTFAGRVATMLYAIFGIPILLMVLADLGKLLTRIIKYAFKKFRYLYNKLLRRKSSVRTRKMISDNTNQYMGVARDAFERGVAYIGPARIPQAFGRVAASLPRRGAARAAFAPQPAPPEAEAAKRGAAASESSDVIVTPAKQTKPVSPESSPKRHEHHHHQHQHQHQQHHHQQHGHHNQQHPKRKSSISSPTGSQLAKSRGANHKSSLSRSSSSSMLPNQANAAAKLKTGSLAAAKQQVDPTAAAAGAEEPKETKASSAPISELGEPQSDACSDRYELNNDVGDDIDDEFDIPVSFALFLLITYMMLGAVVFSIWEQWAFFDSLYFVFISMSTIGFGDLVPQHPKRMIGTFIYLLFGLALTSMCINVVQEKIHATFLRAKMQIGEKMGLDLEQIMADDYYDNSLADDCDDSNASVSQLHSSLAQLSPDSDLLNNQLDQLELPLSQAASVDASLLETGVRHSKSRDSFKSIKKRSVTGLPGHNSGSLRRKPSRRAVSRQSTPTASHIAAALVPDQVPLMPAATPTPAPNPQAPVEIELRPVEQFQLLAPPTIKQPAKRLQGQFCESLRPRTAVVKSLSSGSPRPLDDRGRPATLAGSNRPQRRSADNSRRSSLTSELNQLDDLIAALSRSPASQRFGPLLGIPATDSARSRRLNSPTNRRATSMMSRQSPNSFAPTPDALNKKCSLSTRRPNPPANQSESEAALDELESIKFSIV